MIHNVPSDFTTRVFPAQSFLSPIDYSLLLKAITDLIPNDEMVDEPTGGIKCTNVQDYQKAQCGSLSSNPVTLTEKGRIIPVSCKARHI